MMPYVGIYWLTDAAERLLDELERDSGPPDAVSRQSEGEDLRGWGSTLASSSGDLSGATP